MTLDEWQSLLTCPGWEALRTYLHDWREALKEKLASGEAPLAETVATCNAVKDLIDMDYDTIARFYAPPEQTIRDEDEV